MAIIYDPYAVSLKEERQKTELEKALEREKERQRQKKLLELEAKQQNAVVQAGPQAYRKDYVESNDVINARAQLEKVQASAPGTYSSAYEQQLKDSLDRLQNREKFNYDVNNDALYQQYRNSYMQNGKLAAASVAGQAAAMTGGYGNSYAETAASQAYQQYLTGLTDKIPELYSLALDQYNQDYQNQLTQYGLLQDAENTQYGRYRDAVSDYNAALAAARDAYNTERSFDYNKHTDARDFEYGTYRDTIADQQWQSQFDEQRRQYDTSFDYNRQRDTIADQQWQSQFDEAIRQYNANLAQQQKEYDESVRQYNANLAEQQRQYNSTLAENKRQYDATMEYNLKKLSFNSGSNAGGGSTPSTAGNAGGFYSLSRDTRSEILGQLADYASNGGSTSQSRAKASQNMQDYLDRLVGYGSITSQEAMSLFTEYNELLYSGKVNAKSISELKFGLLENM